MLCDAARLVLVGRPWQHFNHRRSARRIAACDQRSLVDAAQQIAAYELVCACHDFRRAAEIGRDLEQRGAEIRLELVKTAVIGAVPLINDLVVIRDCEHVGELLARHRLQQSVLGEVCVLEFIDTPVAVGRSVATGKGRKAHKELVGVGDEGVEIESVGLPQRGVIGGIEDLEFRTLLGIPESLRDAFAGNQLGLGAIDQLQKTGVLRLQPGRELPASEAMARLAISPRSSLVEKILKSVLIPRC